MPWTWTDNGTTSVTCNDTHPWRWETTYVWNTWTSNKTTTDTDTSWTGNRNYPPVQSTRINYATCPAPKPAITETAKKKAMALLRTHLNKDQRKQLKDKNHFELVGPSGARYRIECNKTMHNVFELDADGKKVSELCIMTYACVPKGDIWLSQKLLLEHDEEQFRRIANHKRLAA